jgi:anti-anti-sigma factor
MDSARVTDDGGTTPDFGQSVIRVGNESKVRVWGACDSARAWLVRDRLDHLAATGQRSITLDVSELRFDDFTAVAILVGALARIRQLGAEVAVCPPSGGAYQVLKRAELTAARAVRIR